MRGTSRWVLIAGAAVVLSLGLVYYSANRRLAFASDEAIASRLAGDLKGLKGTDSIRAALKSKYKVIGEARGRGPYIATDGVDLETYHFHLIVGDYAGLPFRTTVEAFVNLDRTGGLHDVVIRRTTDGL